MMLVFMDSFSGDGDYWRLLQFLDFLEQWDYGVMMAMINPFNTIIILEWKVHAHKYMLCTYVHTNIHRV